MAIILPAPGPIAKGVYVVAITDVPGVVAANNFLCFFNPTTSPITHVSLEVIVSSYSGATSGTTTSMTVRRVTAASGGTLQTPSTVGRFLTLMPDPQTQVFTGNPTVTTTGPNLAAFPPPISTGSGVSAVSGQTAISGASFTMLPGQGLLFFTAAGNVNQLWNIEYVWEEI